MKEKQNKTQKTKTNKQNRKLNLVFGIIYTVLEFILLAAVIIDNKKTAIDVSLDTYNTKQIDDTLIVNYHKGNLNLSYYESAE